MENSKLLAANPKTFRIKVIVRMIEIYEIEADDQEQAEDQWADGRLIATDDDVENEILEVVAVE